MVVLMHRITWCGVVRWRSDSVQYSVWYIYMWFSMYWTPNFVSFCVSSHTCMFCVFEKFWAGRLLY